MTPRIAVAVLVLLACSSCRMTTAPQHMTTPRILLPGAQVPERNAPPNSTLASAVFMGDYVRFTVRKSADNADVGMWVRVDADNNLNTGVPDNQGIDFVFGQWMAQPGTVDLRLTHPVYGWDFNDPADATFPIYQTNKDWIVYIPITYFGTSHLARNWTPYRYFMSTEGRIAQEVAAIP